MHTVASSPNKDKKKKLKTIDICPEQNNHSGD